MSHISITPIVYGRSVLPENMIFQHGAEDTVRPILFMVYLIKAENRFILVDAGCETMPGFDMQDFIGPIKALEKFHIAPEDITDVIITHAHHDHIECVKYLKNALIHIQKDEYENGKTYLTENVNISLFEEEAEICPNVKVIKIGGHTAGSCVVEVKNGQKHTIFAGDECYLRECLEKQIPTGASFCPEKSRAFIMKYSSGEYEVLLCHDT